MLKIDLNPSRLKSIIILSILGVLILGFNLKRVRLSDDSFSIRSGLFLPNKEFLLERAQLLQRIEDNFKYQVPGIQSVALAGTGGSGKTTLARIYGQKQRFTVVWEINAENKDSLINSFNDLAFLLANTIEQKKELALIQSIQDYVKKEKAIINFVKRLLQELPNWLLIYDNVENFIEIKDYFPHDPTTWGDGRIILTTRDLNIAKTSYIKEANVFVLGELNNNETLELFCKILHSAKPDQLPSYEKERIINLLNNFPAFPLDIVTAAYYIKGTHITYEEYLQAINNSTQEFEIAQETLLKEVSNYGKNRYGILAVSLKKLININPTFKELLFFICLLDSQNIPKSLFEYYKNEALFDEFIQELKKYSLVTNESIGEISTFSIHRSTQVLGQTFLLELLSEADKKAFAGKIIKALNFFYELYSSAKNYKNIILIIPHLEALVKNLERMNLHETLKKKYKSDLLILLGYSNKEYSNNFKLAERYLSEVYSMQSNTPSLPASILATLLKDLGEVYIFLDAPDKGLYYCKESIKICETIPNSETLLAKVLKIMAFAHKQKNNFKEAKACLESALNKISLVDRELKNELESIIYGELASLYSATYLNKKESHEAEKYAFKALETLNASEFFSEAPKQRQRKIPCLAASHRMLLSRIYSRMGKYSDALKQIKETEYIIEHSLDTCSHSLFKPQICYGKGVIFLRNGQLKDAESHLTESIRMREDLVSQGYALKSRIYRAEVRIRLGKFVEAYEDCTSVFNTGQKLRNSYFDLIYLICFYHAAIIKLRQGDLEKSFEHFVVFFKGMKTFCKSFLNEKEYKDLEEKRVFIDIVYNKDRINDYMRQFLQHSVTIFSIIHGPAHPFFHDYVLQNYRDLME